MTELNPKRIDLNTQRLLVSQNLGSKITQLIEQKDPVIINPDKVKFFDNQIAKALLGGHFEIEAKSIEEIAYILRTYQPEMIIGSDRSDERAIVKNLASQLSIPESMANLSFVGDRMCDREKVAIVITNANINLSKGLKKLPQNGILILKK